MIIVKLISGLGNQLFQYAIGRQLSIKRNVPLKLDISFFETQNLRSYKLNHYNIKAAVATKADIDKMIGFFEGRSLKDKIFRRIHSSLPKHKKRYYKERENWVYEPNLMNVSSNIYLDGYWQHYKYFEQFNLSILEEFTLKNNERAAYKIIAEIEQNESSVSLHIRRGDYISDSNANNLMGVLPISYYQRAIDYINKVVKNPCYYVFSDDIDWVKKNLNTKSCFQFVDIEDGKKDYLELDAMNKCRHNIIANSSFSWWGAFLNKNPDKIVIAPDKWVKPAEINMKINLQFPSWIKL
jgi:hypothetical protein